jgi:hypothetical protein
LHHRRIGAVLRRAPLASVTPSLLVLLTVLAPGLIRAADRGPVPPAEAVFAHRDPGLFPLRRSATAPTEVAIPFGAELDGEALRLRVTAFSVLPGESVSVSVTDADGGTLAYQDGDARTREHGWRWTAPREPGAYALRLTVGGRTADLTALVLHPASRVRSGVLDGYRIGEYRTAPLHGDPVYLPPRGFAEVRAEDRDLLVSPRLTLGQFLCKEPGEPRFVAVSRPLLVKLEGLLDRVADEGLDPMSLVVMSGFRTPAYNRAIGNTTVYSRHLWGDAADVYLDADGDGDMDDLNRDGRVDVADAHVLADLVEDVVGEPGIRPGGLSTYRRNAVHGPFVHVDARGTRARW